ncbi:hypothetical protein AgCh_024879 [Apium graveolens]
MDSVLYAAVTCDSIDDLKQKNDTLSVDQQRTPTSNTVLHLACQHGSIKCVKEILSVYKSLLLKINSRGETALHLAARYGHYDVVVQLIATAKSSLDNPENTTSTVVQTLLRRKDVQHETALHAAVRYNHHTVVQVLVKEDPSHEYQQNKYNETPVYLAATRGYTDIIRTILHYCESPTFGGPDGRTALHAAVLDKDTGSMKLLLDKKKDLTKEADNYGWTVYHYAAYNNLHKIVEDLLCVDKFGGNLPDKEHKRTPLHVAAYQGHDDVMRVLLSYYPDSWEIADGNGKNVFHLAVEKEQYGVVNLILSLNFAKWNNLLIQRDNDGYTPLHLITKSGNSYRRLMDARAAVDWQVLNNKNFTPLDVLQMTDTEQAEQAIVRRVFNRNDDVKKYWNLWRYRKRYYQGQEKYKKMGPEGGLEENRTVMNTHMIVAALITTVALTAGFAMPGGFDDKEGSAVLRNTPFKTFLVADALALLFSLSSLFLYFLATLSEDNLKIVAVLGIGVLFNSISVIAMMLAFITATYAVLPHLSNIAVTICVISTLFIIIAACAFAKTIQSFVNLFRF